MLPIMGPRIREPREGGRGENPILRGAPLVRELEGRHSITTGDMGKKRYRASNAEAESSVRRRLPKVHGHAVPLIVEGRLKSKIGRCLGNSVSPCDN